MCSTLKAMHAIEISDADFGLVADLIGAPSNADAAIAFTLLRGQLDDRELLLLVNLRELLREIPEAPFRTGDDLSILERASGYEDSGRSYRRVFESSHGFFGIEFVGRGRQCDQIAVRTAEKRYVLAGGDEPLALDEFALTLFVNHGILLDAVFEGLGLIGVPLQPKIYVTADDFLVEHGAAAAGEALAELF